MDSHECFPVSKWTAAPSDPASGRVEVRFLHHANDFLLVHNTCAPPSTRLPATFFFSCQQLLFYQLSICLRNLCFFRLIILFFISPLILTNPFYSGPTKFFPIVRFKCKAKTVVCFLSELAQLKFGGVRVTESGWSSLECGQIVS